MVDSGADDSLIDETLARQAGLRLLKVPEPRTVLDLNSNTLALAF